MFIFSVIFVRERDLVFFLGGGEGEGVCSYCLAQERGRTVFSFSVIFLGERDLAFFWGGGGLLLLFGTIVNLLQLCLNPR